MNERPIFGGGCATEAIAFLLFLYIVFHVQPIIAFLDRLIAR